MKNDDLILGIEKMFPIDLLPWDEYFMTMAQTDFFMNTHERKATKTFFIRKAPFKGSYAIFGGLSLFLNTLSKFSFNEEVIAELKELGYNSNFLKYLKEKKRLNLRIESIDEGSLALPNEPILIIEGDLLSVRLAEGMLCHDINFGTLSMTKWHRVVLAAAPGKVLEFSRRRAQNPNKNTLYAFLAGVHFSSNSAIRQGFSYLPVSGTMGHEFIQSIGDEFFAFDSWLTHNPERPVLLVDTIDTLKSGLPNAIRAFKKHWDRIKKAGGVPAIRNDSGDLAYLTIEERRLLDLNGLEEVQIIQTNDLDEYKIQSIKEQIFIQSQRAGLDANKLLEKVIWAAGTMPGTCYDQPSLGGVAKLTTIESFNGMVRSVIKIAKDNKEKTSIPDNNRSVLVLNEQNELVCCLIYRHQKDKLEEQTVAYSLNDRNKFVVLHGDKDQHIARQSLVYSDNFIKRNTYNDVSDNVKKAMGLLHWTHKRFEMPHKIKVSLTSELFDLRQELISRNKLIKDW